MVQFAEAHGLAVVGRYNNRVVLDVSGSVADIDRAFQTTLRTSFPVHVAPTNNAGGITLDLTANPGKPIFWKRPPI